MPQIYWERGNSHGDFNKVFTWWDQVARYLDVNLYVGIGLYRATELRELTLMSYQRSWE